MLLTCPLIGQRIGCGWTSFWNLVPVFYAENDEDEIISTLFHIHQDLDACLIRTAGDLSEIVDRIPCITKVKKTFFLLFGFTGYELVASPNLFIWITRGSLFDPEKCLKEFILTWWTCFENPKLWSKFWSNQFLFEIHNHVSKSDVGPHNNCSNFRFWSKFDSK